MTRHLALTGALLLLIGLEVDAQQSGVPPHQPEAQTVEAATDRKAPSAGGAQKSIYSISGLEFLGADTTVSTSWGLGFVRFVTAGVGATLVCGAHLPSGAVIDSIELDSCNSDPSLSISLELVAADGYFNYFVGIVTVPPMSCGPQILEISPPHIVDNNAYSYFFLADLPSRSVAQFIRRVKLGYHMQVSPPPAAATFNDVPTSHPFFQFVEAMAASGITAGCNVSPPLYCPDDPVTRGQMAVFLSTALGLYWPN